MKKEKLLELLTRLENYTQMTLQELKDAYQTLSDLSYFKKSEDYMDNISMDTFYSSLTEKELFYFGSWRMEDFEEGVCLYDSELTPEEIIEELDFSFEIRVYAYPYKNEIILRQESDGSRSWRAPEIPNLSSREELLEIFKKLENHREQSFDFLEKAYEKLSRMNSHFKTYQLRQVKGNIAHSFHSPQNEKFLFGFYSHNQTSFTKGVFNYETNLKPEEILDEIQFAKEIHAVDETGKKYIIYEDSEGERGWC